MYTPGNISQQWNTKLQMYTELISMRASHVQVVEECDLFFWTTVQKGVRAPHSTAHDQKFAHNFTRCPQKRRQRKSWKIKTNSSMFWKKWRGEESRREEPQLKLWELEISAGGKGTTTLLPTTLNVSFRSPVKHRSLNTVKPFDFTSNKIQNWKTNYNLTSVVEWI